MKKEFAAFIAIFGFAILSVICQNAGGVPINPFSIMGWIFGNLTGISIGFFISLVIREND